MALYTVAASTDDTLSDSNVPAQDGAGAVTAGNLTATVLSPGDHGSSDRWYVGARFTGIAAAQAATISSATFSLKAQGTYDAGSNVVALRVRAHDADNPVAFGTLAGTDDLGTSARPRTTATSAAWVVTSVLAGTRYSIDVAAVIQEIVNRAGWATGNAIVIIVDLDSTCTVGEWQDMFSWDDPTDRVNNPPQLDITIGAAAASMVPQRAARRYQHLLVR